VGAWRASRGNRERDEEEVERTGEIVDAGLARDGAVEAGVDARDAEAECGEFSDLIFHERDERRDDERCAAESDGGKLVAERLPCPGGHDEKKIAAVDGSAANGFLIGAEAREAEDRLQKLGKVFRIVRIGQKQRPERRQFPASTLQKSGGARLSEGHTVSDESGTTTQNTLQSHSSAVSPHPKDSTKMNSANAATPRASLSDYLAAERTLLAWIRTGLAMMGFGFVVARFGLFLQELQVAQNPAAMQHYGLSLWFGTALIAVGVVVNVMAGWHHLRLIRQLDRGETSHPNATAQAVTVAFLLALVGLAMGIYLISVRGTTPSPRGNKEVSFVEQQRHCSDFQQSLCG
jgi:putative membrane protein